MFLIIFSKELNGLIKKKMSLINLTFVLFVMIKFSKEQQEVKIGEKKVIETVFDFLQYNSSFDILLEDGIKNQKCAERLKSINKGQYGNILKYSGLSLLDVGKEEECKSEGMTYFFFTYEVNYSEDSPLRRFFRFIDEESSFYKGICFYQECMDLLIHLTNYTTNPAIQSQLESMNVFNLSLLSFSEKSTQRNQTSFYIFCFIILVIIIVRLFFNIVFNCCYKDANLISQETIDKSSSSKEESENVDSSEMEDKLIFSNPEKSVKDTFCYKASSLLSISKSVNAFLKSDSNIYNDRGIKQISGIKVIILFFITLTNNSWATSKLPHKDISGLSNLTSTWFILAKAGVLSFEGLKVVLGIELGYKYMGYIKKNSKNFTFKKVLLFYIKILPSLVCFLVTYSCFIFGMEILLFLNDTAQYVYFSRRVLYNYSCLSKPWQPFVPFTYQIDDEQGCFKSINFGVCNFYCFTVLVFLTYILFKIKSNLLDCIIFIGNFCLILTKLFSFLEKNDFNYTLKSLYGEYRDSKQPHLFMILYFFGFSIGIIFYHFRDLSNTSSIITNEYFPFKINIHIMRFYPKLNSYIKGFITLLPFSLTLLAVLNLTIFIKMLHLNDIYKSFDFTMIWLKITYYFEGFFFGLFFGIFVLFLLLGDFYPLKFISNRLFRFLGRLSTFYFLMDMLYVQVFYALYKIEIYINTKSLVFSTIPIAFFNILFSAILTVLFEVPFKRLFKINDEINDMLKEE